MNVIIVQNLHSIRSFFHKRELPDTGNLYNNNDKWTEGLLHSQQEYETVQSCFENLIGEEVKLAELPKFEICGKMGPYLMNHGPVNLNKLLGNSIDLNPFMELFKKILGKSDFTMAAIYSLNDSLLPKEKKRSIREATTQWKEVLQELLGDEGVFLWSK